jgi:SHS family lactate transporter-like MFS transporter
MGEIVHTLRAHFGLFAYLVLTLTFFTFLSHGTQDLYPDFLKNEVHVSAKTVANLAILYNIGAITGAIIFGHLSEKLGRRKTIAAALLLSLLVIPWWAFGNSLLVVAIGAFVMQMGVQGAWGIVPAHLNEMSPDAVRGVFPGLAYQMGILFGAATNTIEFALRNSFGYSWALAGFEIATILMLGTTVLLGSEKKGKRFVSEPLIAVE